MQPTFLLFEGKSSSFASIRFEIGFFVKTSKATKQEFILREVTDEMFLESIKGLPSAEIKFLYKKLFYSDWLTNPGNGLAR